MKAITEIVKNRVPVPTAARSGWGRIFLLGIFLFLGGVAMATELSDLGIYIIPYPQKVVIGGNSFSFSGTVTIVLDKHPSAREDFIARELIRDLKNEWNIVAVISDKGNGNSITLTRKKLASASVKQGYQLSAGGNEIVITASDDQGLFYGTQTLLQLIQRVPAGLQVPGLKIQDWPSIGQRAVHYDTKHHQDKIAYVKSFIRELARYKVNMMIWEWEDKFVYPSHPEIAAPGAFTTQEIQELMGIMAILPVRYATGSIIGACR